MKPPFSLLACAGILLAGVATSQAVVFQIDLSPAGGTALNLGANPYNGDHAVGLAGPNAVGMPATVATGNEIGAGISYDNVSNQLTMDFAYGSAYGFIDLQGALTVLHVHGGSPVNFPAPNTGAGVQFGLAGFHTPSGPLSGRITGVQVLSAAQETLLLDNELYVNIHSGFAAGGEIRGQLIPVIPEPSGALLLGLSFFALPFFRRRRKA